MLKKITYIIIYCLYAIPIEAQQQVQQKQQLIKLLQVIKDNIKVIDNNLAVPCKKNFEKNFQRFDTTSIRKKTLEELLKTSGQIINNYKSPSDTCSNDTIKKSDDLTGQIIRKLKRLISEIADSSKKKLVQLSISVVDDSTNKALNADVNIELIGSADTLRTSQIKLRDSAVFFYASIFPGKRYLITVRDSFYSAYTSELSIVKDSTITIRLRRIFGSVGDSKAELDKVTFHSRSPHAFQTIVKDNTPLFICICVLFFLTLIGTILYIMTLAKGGVRLKKEYAIGLNTTSEPAENIKTKDAMKSTNNSNVSADVSSFEQIEKNHPEALPIEERNVVDVALIDRTFNCEIMMTAGPRKKFMSEPDADVDLGEDVCGFVSNTKEILLWVLDGTSDLHCLRNPINKREYFSSRLLAQFLAEKLRKGFTQKSEKGFDEIVLKAIQEVKEDFLIQIDQLPDEEIILLKKNIENRNFPECATTILIAKLSINGDFTAYRSGDSKMFLFRVSPDKEISLVETFLEMKNEKSNDRLFFRLMLNENRKFNIFYNRPNNEIINEKNINTVISFSDGIGMNTELFLKEEYRKRPDEVRREIAYQLQGTGDDKSICFIEIKETQ